LCDLKETNADVDKKPATDLMLEEKNQQQQQQQQKTRQGDVTVVKIEAAIKALDHNIEKLEAKLSFLIKSYDPRRDLLYQYEKKIDTVKKEIEYAMEERRRLNRVRQTRVITVLR
jgi:predicted RNase H-like nuclease (RuvC/YqgF family)